MRKSIKVLLITTALATAGLASYAQPSGKDGGPMDGQGMQGHRGMMGERMDPAKLEAMMAKRAAELKTRLKLTPDQEGAWNAYTEAMKPAPRKTEQRPDRAELEKLTTPERIDKMRTLRNQHMTDMSAAMDKRDQATKTFYATLSPEQKKTFDSTTLHMMPRQGDKGAAPATGAAGAHDHGKEPPAKK